MKGEPEKKEARIHFKKKNYFIIKVYSKFTTLCVLLNKNVSIARRR